MKKLIVPILLILATVFSTLPVFAEETSPSVISTDDGYTITYFADGSSITVSPVRDSTEANHARATTQTINKSKDVTCKDSDGNIEWKYTLSATFTYEYGVSATCTKASYTKTINNSGWSFSDGSATKSGNVATGKGTFKFKVLFITTQTRNVNITLTCDKYGNVT